MTEIEKLERDIFAAYNEGADIHWIIELEQEVMNLRRNEKNAPTGQLKAS